MWFLIVLGVIAVIVAGMYNSLVRLRVRADSAWADIDVQLKRRWDLIPNLVETVKGYAEHEKETLEGVIEARNRAMTAQGPGEQGAAEGAPFIASHIIKVTEKAFDDFAAGAFEADVVVERQQLESVVTKPLLEELLLRPAFVRHEVAGNRLVSVNDAGVGREHHVR